MGRRTFTYLVGLVASDRAKGRLQPAACGVDVGLEGGGVLIAGRHDECWLIELYLRLVIFGVDCANSLEVW